VTTILISVLTTRFGMPPLALAFWRDLIVAGVLVGALALTSPTLLRPGRSRLRFLILYGLVLAVLNVLWMASVDLNGAAIATVLAYSAPAFTALVSWRWWGERMDASKLGALALSLAGCVFVSGAYQRAAWQVNPTGILVGLATGIALAAYNLMGKSSARRGINPWTATGYIFCFATAFLLLLQRPDTLLWLSRPLAAGADGWREAALGWGTLILLATGPTLGGYSLYTISLTILPAATASLISTLEPVITAVLAFFLLGEQLTAPQLFGGGLILVGVLLLRLGERGGNVDRPE
jgi:DME family drug/metabolite transporter